jgi:endonuclease/exonuclease/phosphatase family metal-dependent hydrolase
MGIRFRRLALVGIAVMALALAPQHSVLGKDHRDITVATYNIYQGTELENSVAATTQIGLFLGAAKDFEMMEQTNFAARARALAVQIDARRPDLVGLQEVALWRTRAPSCFCTDPATAVNQDFLQVLIDALAARGLSYETVSSVDNFDVQSPAIFASRPPMDVRLTDRNVILARANREGAKLQLFNPQHANFTTNLVISVAGAPVTVLEGWASVDAKLKGRSFRFITTHLDAFAPAIRLAQANEILSGPANTTLPVVLVGDMNTTNTTATYAALVGAGFADTWVSLNQGEAGSTCCQVLPTITNAVSALSERIDLVLVRRLEPHEIKVLGANPADRTATGLWPSDHAGLAAALSIKRDN